MRALISFRHGLTLSFKMCSSTQEENERMSQVPYASIRLRKSHITYALYKAGYYKTYPQEKN